MFGMCVCEGILYIKIQALHLGFTMKQITAWVCALSDEKYISLTFSLKFHNPT